MVVCMNACWLFRMCLFMEKSIYLFASAPECIDRCDARIHRIQVLEEHTKSAWWRTKIWDWKYECAGVGAWLCATCFFALDTRVKCACTHARQNQSVYTDDSPNQAAKNSTPKLLYAPEYSHISSRTSMHSRRKLKRFCTCKVHANGFQHQQDGTSNVTQMLSDWSSTRAESSPCKRVKTFLGRVSAYQDEEDHNYVWPEEDVHGPRDRSVRQLHHIWTQSSSHAVLHNTAVSSKWDTCNGIYVYINIYIYIYIYIYLYVYVYIYICTLGFCHTCKCVWVQTCMYVCCSYTYT